MAGERQLSDGRPAGNTFGQSATDLIGFHGATPSDQRAVASAVVAWGLGSSDKEHRLHIVGGGIE